MVRGARAVLCLVMALLASACAYGPADRLGPDPVEVPMRVVVTNAAVVRGRVRFVAVAPGASADMSVSLGRPGKGRGAEIGRGFARRGSFVWELSSDELGEALAWGLVVRARGVDGEGRPQTMRGRLSVSLSAEGLGRRGRDALSSVNVEIAETTIAFSTTSRSAPLHVGGTVVGPMAPVETNASEVSYAVPNAALARAIVLGRPLAIDGLRVRVTGMIGSTEIDAVVEELADDEKEEEPDEADGEGE